MMNCPLCGNAAHTRSSYQYRRTQKNAITSVRTLNVVIRSLHMKPLFDLFPHRNELTRPRPILSSMDKAI
jgi:hypothetical protein